MLSVVFFFINILTTHDDPPPSSFNTFSQDRANVNKLASINKTDLKRPDQAFVRLIDLKTCSTVFLRDSN